MPSTAQDLYELKIEKYARKARLTFLDFCKFMNFSLTGEALTINPFVLKSCEELDKLLDAVEHDRLELKKPEKERSMIRPRLLGMAPPRLGKTYLWHCLFSAYALGKYPNLYIRACSFSIDLVKQNCETTQRIMSSEGYERVFGRRIAQKREGIRNKREFDILGYRGSYKTSTVRGAITGTPANIMIIDDPIKGTEAARSVAVKNAVWDWFNNDVFSRLQEGYGIILMHQRWALDDLAGRVTDLEAKLWNIIKFPAINPDGTTLCPVRLPPDHIEHAKSISPRYFQAMYQQEPNLSDGNVINTSYFKRYAPRKFDKVHFVCDTALKAGQANDYSVISVWAKEDHNHYLVDILRARMEFPELLARMGDMIAKYKPKFVAIEDKASGTSLLQFLRKSGTVVKELKAVGSKYLRVSEACDIIESGYVHIPHNAPWVEDFLRECESFTGEEKANTHDDQVDCLAYECSDQINKMKVSSLEQYARA